MVMEEVESNPNLVLLLIIFFKKKKKKKKKKKMHVRTFQTEVLY